MAIIAQKSLFGWEEIEDLGDLERLRLVIEHMPDEELMAALEARRGRGRDDYPVRAVWNSILAGVVFQHPSIESLRRELARNAQLRELCGFEARLGAAAVPSPSAYSRFLRQLLRRGELIEAMFDDLVEALAELLSGLGETLAIDGKAIPTHARPRKMGQEREPDGRRDTDADFGKKEYSGVREDGTAWERAKSWFGYKLHLLVDADYELPVGYAVTRASVHDLKEAPALLGRFRQRHPRLLWGCRHLVGDKGYDDGDLVARLWDELEIKPVIDIRNCRRDGEDTRLVSGLDNVVYDHAGGVYCHCPRSGAVRAMPYGGFERGRGTLKYRCPARHYGVECAGAASCPVRGAVRIPLSEDRRVFTPLARSSYAWARTYKKRTAVERVNSRLDLSFGFERHFIRGLAKMRLRVGLALSVMLAMALGRVRENQEDKIRSLVRAA